MTERIYGAQNFRFDPTTEGVYVYDPTQTYTREGHAEVEIHGPLNPFGSLHTESLTPIFQTDAVYGINSTEVLATTGLAYDVGPAIGSNTGSNTGTTNLFTCSTGTTAYSFATIQSRKRLRYRAGQGITGRFTAKYSTPAASSILVAGFGTGESGFYFGYNGTSFGILHSTGGVREIQTFTVTNQTTTGGTVTFRLNGLDTQVTLPISATTARTAYDISMQTFPGWTVVARGATVIFLASAVGNKAGTFSFTLGTAVGTAGSFAETLTGVASTDTWIPQASWNGDTLDGTGDSGFTLDQTKGNVYEIGVQYLGFGTIVFKVEVTYTGSNNAEFITVHNIKIPNTRTTTTVSQPSFPFTMAAYSSGSTTNVSVAVGSFAGFLEGVKKTTGPRMTYTKSSTAVTTTNYYTLMTIRNDLYFGGRTNQAVVNLISVGAAHDDTTPVIVFLIKNATLVGPVSFAAWSINSCTFVDQGATTCTITNNEQIVFSLPIGSNGGAFIPFSDEITLQPGETLTLAAQTVAGTAAWTNMSLNTREDQ